MFETETKPIIVDSAPQRSHRERNIPTRFSDFEIHSDDQVTDEDDLIHLALMVGTKLVDEIEDLKQQVRRDAMVKRLSQLKGTKCGNWLNFQKENRKLE